MAGACHTAPGCPSPHRVQGRLYEHDVRGSWRGGLLLRIGLGFFAMTRDYNPNFDTLVSKGNGERVSCRQSIASLSFPNRFLWSRIGLIMTYRKQAGGQYV